MLDRLPHEHMHKCVNKRNNVFRRLAYAYGVWSHEMFTSVSYVCTRREQNCFLTDEHSYELKNMVVRRYDHRVLKLCIII